ncbi:MAG: hypothetical protein M5U26_07515 [Planctomycetota bacterium]|nr:hypothetical protein [Planctomycetota bacterium]
MAETRTAQPPAASSRELAAPSVLESPWAADPVAHGLATILRRERLYLLLAGLLACAAAGLALLLAEMCADRVWEFEGFTRLALLRTAGLGLLVLAFGLGLLVLLRRRNPLFHAREVERALGFQDEALLTYVDLRRRKALDPGERQAAEVLAVQARRRMREVDADRVVDVRPLGWAAKSLGALGLALVLFGFWCGGTFWLTFKRAVMPWQDLPAPRETRILEVRPGTAQVVAGEPVVFEIRVVGARPQSAFLRYRVAGEGDESQAVLAAADEGRYRAELPGFTRAVTYSIACNDAEAGPFNLTPVDRPLVTGVRVRVHPPAYAVEAPIREVGGGDVEAVAGSRLEIHAACNQTPIEPARLGAGEYAAWLEVQGRQIPMQARGRDLVGELPLKAEVTYRIGFRAESGFTSSPGVVYRAKLVPDRPPEAVLKRAGARADDPAPADGVVTLAARASDDLGIGKLFLRYALKDQSIRGLDLTPPRPYTLVEAPASIDLARLGAKPGDLLVCSLVAEDNRPPRPQRAESEPLQIRIVAPPSSREQDALDAARRELPEQPFEELMRRLARLEKEEPPAKLRRDEQKQDLSREELERLRQEEQKLLEKLEAILKQKDPAERERALDDLAEHQEDLIDKLKKLLEELEKAQERDAAQPGEPLEAQPDAPEPEKRQDEQAQGPNPDQSAGSKQDDTPQGQEMNEAGNQEQQPGGQQNPGGEQQQAGGQQNPGGEQQQAGGQQNSGGEQQQPGGQQNPGGEQQQAGGQQNSGGEQQQAGGQQNPGGGAATGRRSAESGRRAATAGRPTESGRCAATTGRRTATERIAEFQRESAIIRR